MYAIEVSDATKRYSDVTALDGLSLEIESGTTFGLLGTNGAGKSTLFKLLVGHVRPDSGSVSVSGTDVSAAGPDLRRLVGYLPEHAGFPSSLTGREVLSFHARIHGVSNAATRIDAVLSVVGLSDAADRHVGGYSNGMTRRLGLATSILHRPRILLLDEPTAGLDPRGVAAFHRVVERLGAETDLTVVVSSHVLSEIATLCDRVGVLHDGRLRTVGDVDELRRDVSDAVRVRVRLDDAAARADLESLVADRAEAMRVVGRSGTEVTVECPQDEVLSFLSEVTETLSVDGYEVREPGLERVFERALRHAEGVRPSPAGVAADAGGEDA